MKLIIGIAILLVAVVAYLRIRSRAPVRDPRKDAGSAARKQPKRDFHAVSIRPGTFACAAARELEGKRFLSRSAPRIPLTNCDAADCTCRFEHHEDRRTDDRRTPYPSTLGLDAASAGDDQRSQPDRRRDHPGS